MLGQSFDENEEESNGEEDEGPIRDDLSVISNISDHRSAVHDSIFEDEGSAAWPDSSSQIEKKDLGVQNKKGLPFRTPLEAHNSFMKAAQEKDTLRKLK